MLWVMMLRDQEGDTESIMPANPVAIERRSAVARGQCVDTARILRSHVSTQMASETESKSGLLYDRAFKIKAD